VTELGIKLVVAGWLEQQAVELRAVPSQVVDAAGRHAEMHRLGVLGAPPAGVDQVARNGQVRVEVPGRRVLEEAVELVGPAGRWFPMLRMLPYLAVAYDIWRCDSSDSREIESFSDA